MFLDRKMDSRMASESPVSSRRTTDEVSLVDLWPAFFRYKWRILSAVLVSVLGGAIYVLVKTPVYQASVTVRVGQVAGEGPFEAPDVVASRLTAQYGEEVAEGVKRPLPFLKRATESKAVKGAVDLVAEGETPQAAALLLSRAIEDLQKTHGEIYSRNVKYLDERLKNVDEQMVSLKRRQEEIAGFLSGLRTENPLQASILAVEGGRLAASIAELELNRPDFALALSRPKTHTTEIIGEITTPADPSRPKTAIVLITSAVTGLVIGVMIALVSIFRLGGTVVSPDRN